MFIFRSLIEFRIGKNVFSFFLSLNTICLQNVPVRVNLNWILVGWRSGDRRVDDVRRSRAPNAQRRVGFLLVFQRALLMTNEKERERVRIRAHSHRQTPSRTPRYSPPPRPQQHIHLLYHNYPAPTIVWRTARSQTDFTNARWLWKGRWRHFQPVSVLRIMSSLVACVSCQDRLPIVTAPLPPINWLFSPFSGLRLPHLLFRSHLPLPLPLHNWTPLCHFIRPQPRMYLNLCCLLCGRSRCYVWCR